MAAEPFTEPIVLDDAAPEAPPPEPARSRRSILGAGLAGLAGLVLGSLGRPQAADAAAGGSLVMGASNDAGTTNTDLATNSTGTALYVHQNGTGTAVRGIANNGIAGFFTSSNGSGVSGVVANNTKYGVYGGNDALTYGGGAAIRAAGGQNHGLVATTASTSAFAIKATNTNAGTGYAAGPCIRALSGGGTDADIDGLALHRGAGEFCGASGVVAVGKSSFGVYGSSVSSYGVNGVSNSMAGVYGVSDTGDGVHGSSSSATGVYGRCDSGVGVYGSTDSGFGLYSNGDEIVNGDLNVIGTLSKGGGSFKIDHPLDPANKFLYHSFVESPDMLNVYSGTVTLDARGEATVSLPAWFDALNRDARIQLTAVGEFSPLYVKSEMHGGSFSMAGGKASQRVYWQLTGIRQDAWANAHRIPVEEEKPAAERGLYLHPTEHGKPDTKGIEQVRNAAMKPAGHK
jgi:hypothetical protein